MSTHYSILAWESHGQSSLAGYSPHVHSELDTSDYNVSILGTSMS